MRVIDPSRVTFTIFAISILVLAAAATATPSASAKQTDMKIVLESKLSFAITDSSGNTKDQVTFSNNQSGTVTPNAAGVFLSESVTASVASNNPTGYSLYFSDQDNNTAMVNQEDDAYSVPSITANATKDTFPANQWGYCFNCSDPTSATFLPIPTAATTPAEQESTTRKLATTDGPGSADYPINFATKVDIELPAGLYKDTVVFSLITNYVQPDDFTSLDTMQEMTAEACAAAETPSASATDVPEAILRDTRDNKYYTVRKLADGNCWMTQNLDLELSTSTTLTPNDSDVTTNWTPTENTYVGSTSSTYWTTSSVASGMASWTGTDWTLAKSYSYNPTQNGDAYVSGGRTNGNTPVGSLTTWSGSFPSSVTPTPTHLAGNYYSFPAATAGTGQAVQGTDNNATSSICPKGWKLPPNTGNQSFYNLLTAYGIRLYEDGYTNTSDADTILSSEKILEAPLGFVRSGYLNYNGNLSNRGTNGYWWSSSGYSSNSDYARYFTTRSGYVRPQSWTYVGDGFSVRCVAQ